MPFVGLGLLWFFLLAAGSSSSSPNTKSTADIEKERVAKKLKALAARAEEETNFLDPEYQESFAYTKTHEVLTTHRQQWQQEYRQISQDGPLYERLQKDEPLVFHWLKARLTIIKLAERADVGSKGQRESKYKETPTEYHQRRADHTIAAIDGIFSAMNRIEDNIREKIAGIEESDLPDDEKQRRIARLRAAADKAIDKMLGGDDNEQAPL